MRQPVPRHGSDQHNRNRSFVDMTDFGDDALAQVVLDISDARPLRYGTRVFVGTPNRLRIGDSTYEPIGPLRRYRPTCSEVNGMTHFDGSMLTVYRVVQEDTPHHSRGVLSSSIVPPENAQDVIDLALDTSVPEIGNTNRLRARDTLILKMRSVVCLDVVTTEQRATLAELFRGMQRDLRCAHSRNRGLFVRSCIGDAAVLRSEGVSGHNGVHATRGDITGEHGGRDYQLFSMVLMPKYDHDLRQYLQRRATSMREMDILRLVASVIRLVVRLDEEGWRCLDLKPTNIAVVQESENPPSLRLIDYECIVPRYEKRGVCTFPHPSVAPEDAYRCPFEGETMLWTVAVTVIYVLSYFVRRKDFPYNHFAHASDGDARRACMTAFLVLLRGHASLDQRIVRELETLLRSLTTWKRGTEEEGDWKQAMELLRERARSASDVAEQARSYKPA